MIITYRNPENFQDCIDVHFDIDTCDFASRWKDQLKKLLSNSSHLEKNYCFMGFTESPRDIDFLCKEINEAIFQINRFNSYNKWQIAGLEDYKINDWFTRDTVMHDENLPIGKDVDGDEMATPGCRLKHDAMNRLHRYFEDLQGEAWGLSKYYKVADSRTKYAIRQLNDLCHELESYVLSYRKSKFEPEWQRPSQINTWLQAPRSHLTDEDYDLFLKNKFDRTCGGVYLHWAQIGKTHIEVFRDEDGKDVDDVICSSINALKYYTGEFDIEWARDVTEKTAPWFAEQQNKFYKWLDKNNFDKNDPKLALGFIKIGQCDLKKSFGTTDPQKVWSILSKHLDVYKIKIEDVEHVFEYVWTQPNYKEQQIKIMEPGYVWSSQR
tara:strand:- start:6822 stop:7961 length:1140 start_codon:yes stop_codon:yes gene_type:complete